MVRQETRAANQTKADDMVLVVEDDGAVRTALSRLLVRNGFEPVQAENLRQAVSAFLRCRKHLRLVIVDLALGTENGMSLIRHLRRRHPELPVVVFTGSGDGNAPSESLALGVSEFLSKPAPPDVIVGAIRRAIERTAAESRARDVEHTPATG